MARKKKILVVDDDKDTLFLIRSILSHDKKYEVSTAQSAEDALEVLEHEEVDAVVSDISMPGMSGTDLLAELRNWDTTLPVVFVSGVGKDADWAEAVQDHASALLHKPFKKEALLKAVAKALQEKESLTEA